MATVVERPDQPAIPFPLPYNHNVAYQAPITYTFVSDRIHANPTPLTSSSQILQPTTPPQSFPQLPPPIHTTFNFSRSHDSISTNNPYKSTHPQRHTSTPLLSPTTTASLKSRIETRIKSMPPGGYTTTTASSQYPKSTKPISFSSTSFSLSTFSFASRSASSYSTNSFYTRSQKPSTTRSRSRTNTHTPRIIHRLRIARIALRTISLLTTLVALALALIALLQRSTVQYGSAQPYSRTNTNTTTSTPLIVFTTTIAFVSLLFIATFIVILTSGSAYLSPSTGPCVNTTPPWSATWMRRLGQGRGRKMEEVVFAMSGVLAGAAIVAGCIVLAQAGGAVADGGVGGEVGRAAWWVAIGVLGSEGVGMGAGVVGVMMGRRGRIR